MIGEAEFHGRCHPQGLMDAAPVVERDMQGDSRTVWPALLTVSIGSPRTPAQVHPHGEVGPLNMVCGGFAEIGIAPRMFVYSPRGQPIRPFCRAYRPRSGSRARLGIGLHWISCGVKNEGWYTLKLQVV